MNTMKKTYNFSINCILLLLCLLLGFVYQSGRSAGFRFHSFSDNGNLSEGTGVIADFNSIVPEGTIAGPAERTGEITDSVFRVIQNADSLERLEIPVTLFIVFALIWSLLFTFGFRIVIPSITASLRMIIHFILNKIRKKEKLGTRMIPSFSAHF